MYLIPSKPSLSLHVKSSYLHLKLMSISTSSHPNENQRGIYQVTLIYYNDLTPYPKPKNNFQELIFSNYPCPLPNKLTSLRQDKVIWLSFLG